MLRLLFIVTLSLCAIGAHAGEVKTFCYYKIDANSEISVDREMESLQHKGYELTDLGLTTKKATFTYVGTGLRIVRGREGKGVLLSGVVENSPAGSTGFFSITKTYVLESIDGVSVLNTDISDAAELLKGDKKKNNSPGVTIVFSPIGAVLGEGRRYVRYIERKPIHVQTEAVCQKVGINKK